MAVIKVDKFSGLAPKFAPDALPDSAAMVSERCNYNAGALCGIQTSSPWSQVVVQPGQQILGGFIWQGKCSDKYNTSGTAVYTFSKAISAAQSPARNDTHRRFYWTEESETAPSFRYVKVPDIDEVLHSGVFSEPAYKGSTYIEPGSDERAMDATQVSFKVGCINTSAWPDRKLSSVGIEYELKDVGLGDAVGTLGGMSAAMFVEAGSSVVQEKAPLVAYRGTQDNGWNPYYQLRLLKPIGQYFTQVSGSATYAPRAIVVQFSTSTAKYSATGWYVGDELRYAFVPSSGYEGASTKGSAVTVHQITNTNRIDGGGDSGSGWVDVEVVGPPITLYYDADRDHRYLVSTAGGSVPDALVTSEAGVTVSVTQTNPTVRFDVELVIDDVRYATSIYEDDGQNKPISLGGTLLKLSMTRVTATNLADVTTKIGAVHSFPFGNFSATPLLPDQDFIINVNVGVELPIEVRQYVATFVNQIGEESFPSEPIEVALDPGMKRVEFKVNTSQWLAKYDELYSGRHGGHGMRFYRSATSSTGDTEYLYAFTLRQDGVEITDPNFDDYALSGDKYLEIEKPTPVDGVQYYNAVDTVETAALGSACPTQGMLVDSEELQKLQGLKGIHNGMLAAYSGSSVYISEPYLPWCWNANGVHTLPHKIMCIVPLEQGFVALTNVAPYYFSGNLPEQMMSTRIPGDYPCVGKNAATSIGSGVLYISTDGPVMINGMNASVDTSVWSRETWRSDFLPRIVANGQRMGIVAYGHRLVAFVPGEVDAYVFDIDDGNWTYIPQRIDCVVRIPAGALEYLEDQLAYSDGSVSTTGTPAYWNLFASNATTSACTHKTKTFVAPRPVSMAAVQVFGYARAGSVDANKGKVTVNVYADDVRLAPFDIAMTLPGTYGMEIARLSAGRMAARWSVQVSLSQDTVVTGIHLATSMKELQGA